jgi:predicted RNA methylase
MVAVMKPLLLLSLTLAPLLCEGAMVRASEEPRTMYDKEYFPTPSHVIEKMLAPYMTKIDVGRHSMERMDHMTVLDPSAGTGSILKYVHERFHHGSKPDLHAIEINPDMQATLREKFVLVHDDFLTFQTDVRYDLILMNPPFSNGDAHLEHAWNIMQHGDIVCLLNAETIRNPHTQRRQWLVQLIEDHGSVEYIGQAFRHSQRPTDVVVALVRLTKHDEADRFTFWENEEFQPEERDFSFSEESMSNMPAVNDRIAAMVHQYQLSQKSFVEYMKSYRRMMHHAGSLVGDRSLKELMASSVESGTGKACFNTFVTGLQREAWDQIFQRTKINDLMTRGVRADFDKMRKSQGGMPLTEANIHSLLQLLFLNRETILQRCVEEAFDHMCAYHDGNKSGWEGWRTNNAFKVNRKVIMPDWAVKYDKEYGTWGTSYCGDTHQKWDDIDRAMAMLEGKTLSSPSSLPHRQQRKKRSYSQDMEAQPVYSIFSALNDRFSELNENRRKGAKYIHYEDNVCESEYFHIKFWKKGTVHLVFKSEELWQRFNIQAAGGKKWVPYDMDRTPTPTSDPADKRYAKRLEEINVENRKLMLTA